MSNQSLSLTDPPKNYPKSKLEYASKLRPIELDWNVLKMAIKETSDNYLNKQWTESVCKSYLHTHAINNHACDRIIANCKNLMAKRMVNEMTDKNIAVSIIIKQAKIEPDMFNVWRGGPYWKSNINFKCFIDAIMYLLLLGVTK